MSLPDALERAAGELGELAERIRPANGDPDRLLKELGGDDGAQVLVWLLANDAEAGEELLTAWLEDADGAAVVANLDEAGLPKPARKLLRRALHRLRGRGVKIEAAAPAPRVAKLGKVEDELSAAFISPIDPSGARAIILVESVPSGGARIYEIVGDDVMGIRHCEVFSATRGQARRFLRDVERRKTYPGIAVPADSARALVARCLAAQPADRVLPQAFEEWRSQVAVAPEGARTPGELARDALAGESDRDQLERALEMLKEGQIGPWPPPMEGLRAVAEEIQDASKSRIVVSEGRRRDRIDEILRDAQVKFFDETFSQRTAARFDEAAYVFWKTDKEREARACLAAANSFAEQPGADNPVARAILERLLEPVMAEQQEAEESSLLVKP